jgi:LmbE family N-acetylglucosaminyl deacetylase
MNAIARRVLILAPHPDDEIVACGIAAARAVATGTRVFVLHLTTGVPPADVFWRWQRSRHAERVRRRREEASHAARRLGCEIVGLRETDARRLRFDLDAAARDARIAVARCDAEVIWVPAFEGAHQDHDAANAVAATLARGVPVWEFAAYNFAGGRVRSNCFPPDAVVGDSGAIAIRGTAAETAAKRAALALYASERRNLRHIAADRETCRPLPAHDYGRQPHAGRLFRERFHWVPFRHPGVDFDGSAEIYRDLAAWVSAARAHHAAPFGDTPGEEARHSDREFARPLDQPQRQGGIGRQAAGGG